MKRFTLASTTWGSNAHPANFTVVCAATADVRKRRASQRQPADEKAASRENLAPGNSL